MFIGITTRSNTKEKYFAYDVDEEKMDNDKLFGYSYCLSNGYKLFQGALMRYGDKINEGDILCLILDLNKKQIKFMVNDKDLGIAFRNIICRKDVTYRLAVSLHSINDSVTITKFECVAPNNQ